MRKIFIAIAASLLIAVGSAVSLKQTHSKFLQTAQAYQGEEDTHHPAPHHAEEEAPAEEEEHGEWHEGEGEGEWAGDEEPEEPEEVEEEPEEEGEEEPLELAQKRI